MTNAHSFLYFLFIFIFLLNIFFFRASLDLCLWFWFFFQRMELTDADLLRFAAQACSGLEYLHTLRFIHRDLAARNLLMNKARQIKIADFGLSRELIDSDYYRRAHKR